MRSTCAITKPLEFFAAMAAARLSSVSASRSIVMLPFGSAGRAADERDVDRERLVEQPFLAVDLEQLDEVLGRHAVELAALLARIDEGAQCRPCERRPARRAAISR